MFTNLIESNADISAFKRRSSFFLITVAAYAVILFAAGVASIYAYDAQLEAQTSSLELLNWLPPVTPAVAPKPPAYHRQQTRRPPASAPVDRRVDLPVRTQALAPTTEPRKIPDDIGVKASPIPPVTGRFRIGSDNVDPLPPSTGGAGNCLTCSGTETIVLIPAKPPEPPPVIKPRTTERLSTVVLNSKAVNLPQPAYPAMARQTRTQGLVSVQILVDEQGKVISAQAVSGSPLLTSAARDAATRARFTPTTLNGVAVKVQGVITYNFVLQ